MTKTIICDGCEGKGGNGVARCRNCKGQGSVMVVRQLGRNMIQQMQSPCGPCKGKGEIIPEGRRCKKCRGNKVTTITKTLDVPINAGSKHGQKIVFNGEADEAPGTVPGNVIIILQAKRHPIFKREGRHLIMTKKLTLRESLCGFEFVIHHLDGRRLLVKSEPNMIYKHGQCQCITDEGMQDSYERGNMYIEFEVEFKKAQDFSALQCKVLKSVLPKPPKINIDREAEDVEEVPLIEVDIEEEKKKFKEEKAKNIYDEDEEEEGGRQQRGPGCTTQ